MGYTTLHMGTGWVNPTKPWLETFGMKPRNPYEIRFITNSTHKKGEPTRSSQLFATHLAVGPFPLTHQGPEPIVINGVTTPTRWPKIE